MPSSLDLDLRSAEDCDDHAAWRVQRLRRIGYIYGSISSICTVVEAFFGLPMLAWVYALNTVLVYAFTASVTQGNQVAVERLAIAVIFGTCLSSVLLTDSPMNFSYLFCLLCVTSIHEQSVWWQRCWTAAFWSCFLICVVYFAWAEPIISPIDDYYRSCVPLLFSVALLVLLLHEYININRQAFDNQTNLNARLSAQIELGHQSSLELEEQMLARQRVSRSVEQSIKSALLTRSRLEANHEQLEQFAYAASHDLKEPVRTIRSFMQMVRRKLPAEAADDASLAEHFDYIESNAHAMHNVLERLLMYSRASRVEACAKTCAIQRVWAAALAKSSLPAGIKQAHLAALVTSQTILAEVDASKLQAVFLELLENAHRFVQPGLAPSLRIEIDQPTEGRVLCRLIDQGIGIEEQYLHQVFGLFTRLHPREQYPSAGVGLALVKRLLDQIDGKIEIESVVGQGTSVSVSVPAGPH